MPFIPRIDNPETIQLKFKRSSKLNENLFFLQLTKDQRPEDKDEYQRIIENGGRIRRVIDEQGNKVGPYRV